MTNSFPLLHFILSLFSILFSFLMDLIELVIEWFLCSLKNWHILLQFIVLAKTTNIFHISFRCQTFTKALPHFGYGPLSFQGGNYIPRLGLGRKNSKESGANTYVQLFLREFFQLIRISIPILCHQVKYRFKMEIKVLLFDGAISQRRVLPNQYFRHMQIHPTTQKQASIDCFLRTRYGLH